MSSNDEDEAGGRKRFDRHQVEVLKSVFRDWPHPDERQREELSIRLGLRPQQIKLWFQNRRIQIKAQNDKLANQALHDEIEIKRCKIIEMQMAYRNCVCSKCRLPLNHKCVKAEIDRCMEIIINQLGNSFVETSLMQVPLDPMSNAEPANLSNDPSLDIDVISNNSSVNVSPPLHPINTPVSNSNKALLVEQATNAMNELVQLVTAKLWIKPMYEDKEILDLCNYRRIFKKIDHHFYDPNIRVEASRAMGLVCMNPLTLVDMFMDPAKWTDLFQTVVSKAKMIDVLSVGMGGNNHSGALLLMHSDIGIPFPLIRPREYYFVRYCQKVENVFWFITDVSVHLPGHFAKNRRLPSGCLIQEMPNGHSKVTWVEHQEVEENNQNQGVIQNFVQSGMAFGAQRWLTTLQRVSERLNYFTMWHDMNIGGVIATQESKGSIMTLSHSMVKSFCNSLCPGDEIQQWITLLDANEIQIRVLSRVNGNILNAITSIWLPFSTERIFSFFKDEPKRDLWDILSIGSVMQPITKLYTGLNVGNCVSLLRSMASNQNPVMLLQETCTDSSISMLVYAPVDDPSMEIVMSGGDTSNVYLIPSGVAILPNCSSSVGMGPSSSSNPTISGSFMTLSFQILMRNQSTTDLDPDTLTAVNNMMSDAVQNVKNALNFT